MVRWGKLIGLDDNDRRGFRDEVEHLLPTRRDDMVASPLPAKEVTKVALRLKHQIETVVPCELDEAKITAAHSPIITEAVIKTAKSAGGEEYKSCVVYCLLIVKKWFRRQATLELWDADLHNVRAMAAEMIAKRIIESEEDMVYLLEDVLLKRYSLFVDNEDTLPANAIERAVDLHALQVIGSSGYQKCIAYLWRGWLVQDDDDPSRFVDYKKKVDTRYWVHFDPDRMRVPQYQNAVQMAFSFIFLALYTGAINSINPSGDLDPIEGLLYIFTLGFILDEANKFWKVGWFYISFWNMFNSTLYALLTTSFITRMIALGHNPGDPKRAHFNELSYNFLAFSAPMFWGRLLLYLDAFRFFGAMIVVIKVMMRESLIFFALLFFVLIGFLQAFIGMDQVDNNLTATGFIIQAMINAVMQSPDLDGFDNYAPPFGMILYYIYTFVIMVILLNILIALYNSAYEDITDNAIDEYMALFSQKTMQFVRAPDENVFIAPFNLIELFCLVLPFEWWMSKAQYEHLNDIVMTVLYSPLLLVTAGLEARQAQRVKSNRMRKEEDDDEIEEWEQMTGEIDMEAEGWTKKVEETAPNVAEDGALVEVKKLRAELSELKELLLGLKGEMNGQ
ncbi:hypothetical protein W97_02801 [Coniosporium apollinis CBS 100218]|uniref:Uncharacterized protein n=1 Tax=Coniosporium apollinis (strain CBS 100218) TaxID=1168221 RepID=R7YNZ0_CONA1|nr:uncharacterized protein W97_02801 [Coniosporium apollinis CBS 100218]EON63573.1 hypothetical protein W97_02801 [Coniosporium apollinis CBS 100218]